MKTQNTNTRTAGTNPNHNTQDRSSFLKAQKPVTSAEIERASARIPTTNPTVPPAFLLLNASSIIGRIALLKIHSAIKLPKIAAKPRPIAHQANFIFDFSLNVSTGLFSIDVSLLNGIFLILYNQIFSFPNWRCTQPQIRGHHTYFHSNTKDVCQTVMLTDEGVNLFRP